MRQPDQVYYVNVVAEYSSVWDLENIVIEPSVPVLLKDIATIRVGVKEETSYSRVNGKEAVTVQLVRDAQVNLLALAENTYPVIERLNREMASEGLEIVIESDSAEYLRENIDLIINLALTGGLLAVLILWFFLQNLRLIAVIALSLPISVLTAFNFFYAFDITLNSLTLIGMALAVGMLLDNSIVVLENVYRLVQQGAGPFRAALEGTREVWRSIAAATLTTITVFLPFVFATNFMVRILGYQIGVSIISTLLISLLVALLLIPMVTHHFLKRRDVALKPFYHFSRSNRLVHIYLVLLKSAMRFPVRTVVVTLVIFFASLLAALALSLSGEQEAQQEDLTLYVTMPSGATLATTDQAVSEIEAGLEDIPEFESIVSQVYEEDAVLTLKLKEDFEDIRRFKLSDVKG
ncbi:MAG: efflux RND transporter permease subunit, partial [Calditrichaeota bacterium]|nr:efflux RND transporter permease subunit [Calditrichota bacterium]